MDQNTWPATTKSGYSGSNKWILPRPKVWAATPKSGYCHGQRCEPRCNVATLLLPHLLPLGKWSFMGSHWYQLSPKHILGPNLKEFLTALTHRHAKPPPQNRAQIPVQLYRGLVNRWLPMLSARMWKKVSGSMLKWITKHCEMDVKKSRMVVAPQARHTPFLDP